MEIFSVSADVESFGIVQETASELARQAAADGIAMDAPEIPSEPLQVEVIIDKGQSIPDIAAFGPTDFALSPKATAVLRPHLDDVADFIPLDLAGIRWYALRVRNHQDILDRDNTVRRIRPHSGRPGRFIKTVIHTDRLADGRLFCIVDRGAAVWTTDAPKSLYSLVTEHGLSGLTFSLHLQ